MQFRKLIKYSDRVQHAYTLKPLDFGNNANMCEKKEMVLENYKKICRSLNLDDKNLYRPYQTHTNFIKKVNEEKSGIFTEDFQNIDGLITDKKDKVLSLSFADCTPLFFYSPLDNVIANVHSGWQGTYKEIAREAVKTLNKEYGCNPANLMCFIGPFIRKCCFEVDEDVKEMFYKKFEYTGRIDEIIEESENNSKYYIDTGLINKIILKEEGLNEYNIIDSGICTACYTDKLYSYRVEKENAGRNCSIISLI